MPVAVHIAAVPTHAASGAAGAGVRGKANSANPEADSNAAAGSPGASSRNFGALFREQARMAQPVITDPAPVDKKADDGAGPAADLTDLPPELGTSVATDASSASRKAIAGAAEVPAAGNAAASESPQALFAAQLKSDLSKPAQAGAEIAAADSSGEADLRSAGKKITERPSPQGQARKEEAPSGDQKHAATSSDGSGSPPVLAVVVAPVAVPLSVPAKAVVAATKSSSESTGAPKTVPAQTMPASPQDTPASVEDHNASASVSAESPGDNAHKLNLNNAGVQPVANSAVNDGVADPKASGPAVKASTASAATAQHSPMTHAAVGGSTAPAAAAAPSSVHGSEVPNSAPRMAQPMQAASSAIAPTTNAAPAAAGSAYDRIDQGVAPVVLHSGAQHVSVGVQDPNLGWVEIKTQNLGGHVDATLVTASGQSHDALAAQLPAMAQFLEQRDVRIGALAVHHEMPGAQGGLSGNAGGSGANHGGGAGYSGHAGSGAGSGSGGESKPIYAGPSSRLSRSASRPIAGVGVSEDAVSRPVSYISVRA